MRSKLLLPSLFATLFLLWSNPALAQTDPEEVPTVKLSAAFLSSVRLPEFFVRAPDDEFVSFRIGSNRFGPAKDVVIQNDTITLYREGNVDPETGEKPMVPVIREPVPEDTSSAYLVFYFNFENQMLRRIFTEPDEGPQPLTMRLINLMENRIVVMIKNDRMGEGQFLLKPGDERNVDLPFQPGESFWYRYVMELPDAPPRDSRWKSMSLLQGQRMIVFYTNLRMVTEEFDEETGEVTDEEIVFRPTDLRIMELLENP